MSRKRSYAWLSWYSCPHYGSWPVVLPFGCVWHLVKRSGSLSITARRWIFLRGGTTIGHSSTLLTTEGTARFSLSVVNMSIIFCRHSFSTSICSVYFTSVHRYNKIEAHFRVWVTCSLMSTELKSNFSLLHKSILLYKKHRTQQTGQFVWK